MARRVYRVCRSIHRRLDGFGAKLAGGRWNSQGHAVVYMAESVSLAVLENLVHMSREDFPVGYICISASISDHLAILEEFDLRQSFPNRSTANLGDLWIESLASAVLRVRSAVVFGEYNYLLKIRRIHNSARSQWKKQHPLLSMSVYFDNLSWSDMPWVRNDFLAMRLSEVGGAAYLRFGCRAIRGTGELRVLGCTWA